MSTMDSSSIYGVSHRHFLTLFLLFLLPLHSHSAFSHNSSSSSQINSNSILVALLDSHYTELAELVEKALLLQKLEEAVGNHNITIFAPRNQALERDLDPEFKRFLLEPRNLRLVSEGYVLTVLAPNDEAMAKLTTDQLSEPGAPEQIMYYHIIPEYQTEESMYNTVRRFGKVSYDTLRLPHKVLAQESDGSVKFGHGDSSAYLFDPDIYTDGRISVQGIDGVLIPPEEEEERTRRTTPLVKVAAPKPRREEEKSASHSALLSKELCMNVRFLEAVRNLPNIKDADKREGGVCRIFISV
ncbi:Fasciclin-like arabinogalactan protein 15 [Glycine soja]|nr:Fasciclin-like arabinogalactan protein 15 [Glycine soja]